MQISVFKKVIFVFTLFLFLTGPIAVSAAQVGESQRFYVAKEYDLKEREQITATLRKMTPQLYFYIDDDWWDTLLISEKEKKLEALSQLSNEFETKIYPTMTSLYGTEWKPGIDKDERITILIQQMQEKAGGYFNEGDEYSQSVVSNSNEREMIYLNSRNVESNLMKSYLSHEFTHLITFNQKDKKQGVTEEIWLNELRAEYSPTLLGYDSEFEGSNLEQRVKIFITNPSDSLTEWKGKKADYGVTNLFGQYVVDHYGVKILADSLKSKEVGIPSINYALKKNKISEDFSQIFANWTITVVTNNCSFGENFCHKNSNLKELKISPLANFLPLMGESTISVSDTTTNWTGNWYKIIGGKDILKFEFSTNPELKFKVPYIIENLNGSLTFDYLELKDSQGQIFVPDFNKKNISLTFIPFLQNKTFGFNGEEKSFPFTWKTSTVKWMPEEEERLIAELKEKVAFLQAEIVRVQAEIDEIKRKLYPKFERDLYFGLKNDSDVERLQKFLKSQGSDIYPEGLVTGNYLNLTKAAVIKFQEKHFEEILQPLGLREGTGYFGSATRALANKLITP